jgi:hypothetical protein
MVYERARKSSQLIMTTQRKACMNCTSLLSVPRFDVLSNSISSNFFFFVCGLPMDVLECCFNMRTIQVEACSSWMCLVFFNAAYTLDPLP